MSAGASVAVLSIVVPDKEHLSLLLSAPDALQETITLCQSVEGVVALAHGADETAESVDLVLAGVSAVLVDLSNGDLDGGVVLGLDDAVGGAALAWDETVKSAVLAIVNSPNPSFYPERTPTPTPNFEM